MGNATLRLRSLPTPEQDYRKLLLDNVTASIQLINIRVKMIAAKLELDDRIERLSEQNAFITLKDHKDNFLSNPKCRLMNPTKS